MKQNPGYTDKHDLGMFWSETAYQYRYAKMFGENNPQKWEILNRDYKLQYPDGVDTWKDYTTFMEPIHGLFYYYFISHNVPFHIFILWFVSIFSALLSFLIYFAVRMVWNKQFLAFISSISWMLIPASFFRQVSVIYLKEDFSLIFIFLFVFLFITGLKNKKIILPVLGGISLFISLTSWHFSQFIFLLFIGCIYIVYILEKEWKEHYTRNLSIYLLSGILAGFVPVLWNRTFIFSQPMLIGYSMLITLFTQKWWTKYINNKWSARFIITFIFIIIFSSSNLIFNTHLKEYAHVFQLFWYKLLYFGVMPDDPAKLPFEARVFWAGNFNSLNLNQFVSEFQFFIILVIILPILFLFNLIRKKLSIQEFFIFLMLVGSIVMAFMTARLTIFLAPMIAVSIGIILITLERKESAFENVPKKKSEIHKKRNFKISSKTLAYLFVLIIMILNFRILLSMTPVIEEKIENRVELFDWIKKNTSIDDAFISSIGDGPMILLYTGRPVILNSQYENSFIRRRTEEFYSAFFGSENDLFGFCKKYDAKYVVINTNMTLPTKPGTARFSACVVDKLPVKSAAALIQFYPESMIHFTPVFDNSYYRIVRVLYENDKKENYNWIRGYNSYFDPLLFKKVGDDFIQTDSILTKLEEANKIVQETGVIFASIAQIIQKVGPQGQLNVRDRSLLENNLQFARNNMKRAISINPREYMNYYNMGILEAQVGNFEQSLTFLIKGLEFAPSDASLQSVTFDIMIRLQKWDKMIDIAKNLSRNQVDSSYLLSMIGYAYLSKQDFIEAYRYSNDAIISSRMIVSKKLNISSAYYVRGISAFRMGKIFEAEQDLIEFKKNNQSTQLKETVDKILSEITSLKNKHKSN
jgi:tetratricopeptide (TPR) repeat protein